MPTYEYECLNCHKHFEIFQKITDEPLSQCPQCKKKGKIKRLISAGSGIIFKGRGFYSTDYKKKNGDPSPKPECSSCNETTCPQKDKKN